MIHNMKKNSNKKINNLSVFDKNFKEILTSQLVSISGGLIAGIVLAVYTDKIFLIPGMLILLPGFLEMRGNISGSLASRISSGLFLGVIKTDKINTPLIRGNILASFLLAVLVSFALGTVTFLLNFLAFRIFTPEIIIIAIIAGCLANLVEIPLTLLTTLYIFKKGYDPNNIMGPFVTSTGDIISILSLLIALVIV